MLPQFDSRNLASSANLSGSNNALCSWAQINLGIELRGVFVERDVGRLFEADLTQHKWRDANNLAEGIARLVEDVFCLDRGAVESRLRYVEIAQSRVELQITIGVLGKSCPDGARLNAIVCNFVRVVVPSADIFDAPPKTSIAPSDDVVVKERSQDFLRACGGKPIDRKMQVVVDDFPVATLSGYWCDSGEQQSVEPVEKTIEALYDGRRFRSRVLYAIANSGRAKSYEIFYDEEKFDQPLRELGDDKRVMLSLVVKEFSPKPNKLCYELISLRRIDGADEFKLS